MKLYSGPLSLFTAKVRVALAEKGIAHDRVEVGWSISGRYEPHHPDVLALNPKREVPVLVDGDVVVYDSTLVLEYLEDAYPDPPLYPRHAAGRARCRQLEAAADEILFPHVWALIEESLYPPADDSGARDTARLDRARAGIDAYQAGLEKDLTSGPFLCGPDFTVADIGNYVFVQAAASLGAAVPEARSDLRAWIDRVGERPPVRDDQRAMRAYLAESLSPSARTP